MDAQLKAKWVEALRSGRYEQGRSFLHTEKHGEHRYCCLGVLAEVVGEPSRSQPMRDGSRYLYDGKSDMLSTRLNDIVGLTQSEAAALANMNDGVSEQQVGFNVIADYIEEML